MQQTGLSVHGRRVAISNYKTLLRKMRPRPIVLIGPSGIGKSALLRAAHEELCAETSEISVLEVVETPAYTVEGLCHSVMQQIMASPLLPLVDTPRVVKAIARTALDHPWALAGAALIDGFNRLMPGTSKLAESMATQLTQELSKSMPRADLETRLNSLRLDPAVGLQTVIRGLAEAGCAGTIAIDQLEAAPEAVVAAVVGMSAGLPPSWSLTIAVNDEIPEGIQLLANHGPRLAYLKGVTIRVDPLDRSALEAWYKSVHGTLPDGDTAAKVLAWCQGRPLMLQDWIARPNDIESLRDVWSRLGPYYEHRLSSLTVDGRNAISSLALVSGISSFPFDLVHDALGFESEIHTLEVLAELKRSNFLYEEGLGVYSFTHDVTRSQIVSIIPDPVRRALAAPLIPRLRRRFSTASTSNPAELSASYALVQLELTAGEQTSFLESAIDVASRLARTGALTAASKLFSDALGIAEALDDRGAAIQAKTGLADMLHALGRYEAGLAVLADVGEWPAKEEARGMLISGRLLLRLNRYGEARLALDAARRGYADLGLPMMVAACDKEEATILRDQGNYSEAVSISKRALSAYGNEVLDPLGAAAAQRALARSLAFVGPLNEALEASEKAREIAEREGALDAIGNAYLAQGEAFRLQREPSASVASYRRAIDIARQIGNVDSLLWACLGLGDSYYVQGQASQSQECVDEVAEIIGIDVARHPLENLHLRLSQISLDTDAQRWLNPEVMDLLARYRELGVLWPSDYVEERRRGVWPASPKRF